MRKAHVAAVKGFLYRCLRRVTREERRSPDPMENRPSRVKVFGAAASSGAEEAAAREAQNDYD